MPGLVPGKLGEPMRGGGISRTVSGHADGGPDPRGWRPSRASDSSVRLSVLERAGFEFARVAGTSGGRGVCASFLAAGMSCDRLVDEMRHVDYKRLEDGGQLARLGTFGQSLSALFEHGAFRGDYLHEWVADRAGRLQRGAPGPTSRRPGVTDHDPIEERYKLVVIASDISRGKMLRLPWDYPELCGSRPRHPTGPRTRCAQSASIPFFFQPVRLSCGG